MADRFTPPTMAWTSPGDLHKRFKFFEQKCDMIFKGPLKEVTEDGEKVNYMLLWAGDKALEIYNAHTFASDADKNNYKTVMDVLKAYGSHKATRSYQDTTSYVSSKVTYPWKNLLPRHAS